MNRMKNDETIDFQNDWKVITVFIGGNDLCDFCDDKVSRASSSLVVVVVVVVVIVVVIVVLVIVVVVVVVAVVIVVVVYMALCPILGNIGHKDKMVFLFS